MNTVEEGTADAGFPHPGRTSPDREILAQGEVVQKELNREARLDRKRIHGDIYKKEASMDKFGRENIEARMKINPPDRNIELQDVNNGTQAEGLAETGNTRPREVKNVLAGSLKEPVHTTSAAVGKDIKAGNMEKPHILAGQDDHGAARGAAGEATRKTGKGRQEDSILPTGREPARIHADHLAMTTKAADFQPAKTNMDAAKSIYQNVVDQIREGISLSANKDGGQVRLNLKPESMGQLDMRIAVRNESVQIIMTVENEKVHQAMNAHIDDLKTALQNQGLKVDKIEVALQYQPGHEGSFHREEANYRFNPGQNGHQGRPLNQEPAFGDDRYPHSGQEVITAQGGAEGVSIFA
jgi:flagellar hook-length control protein FliK